MEIQGVYLVELPGARDIERVKNLLQSTAQLEFWETESKDKLTSFLFQANELLKQTVVQDTAEKSLDDNSEIDDLLADIEAQQDSVSVVQNPIFDLSSLISIFLDLFLFALRKKTKALLIATFSDQK